MSAAPPEIDGYRIERTLGQGGMAVVYLATQLSLDRRVAIKVLSDDACRDEQHALRFEREARLIAALEHPHIVGIFEVGRTTAGQPFYAMPYMPKGDLAAAGLKGDEAAIAEVLDKILSALEYAHRRGIVHRDVKPANVLFDGFGQPRLADFGIARPSDAGLGRLTTEGLAVGSSSYMAPEQARGEEVDARADLYSVGVMAFELLTGELPFKGPDPLALALQHLTAPVPRLPARFAHWQAFIDRALAKQPEERFGSAEEMRKSLATLSGLRPQRHRRWPRWAIGLAAAVVLLLLAFGGWLTRDETAVPPDFFLASPGTEAEDGTTSHPADSEEAIDAALAQARARLAAGALALPADDNAAQLALNVLRARPTDAEALALLAEIGDAILGRTIEALRRGDAELLRASLAEAEAFAAMQGGAHGLGFRNRLREQLARENTPSPAILEVLRDYGLDPSAKPAISDTQAEHSAPLPGRFVPVPSELRFPGAHSRLGKGLAALSRPVTRREFEQFLAATGHRPADCRGDGPFGALGRRSFRDPGFPQEPDDPAVCVSYADAEAFAAWQGARLKRRVRLPREDELQHLALHQLRGMGVPLTVREWTSSCAGRGGNCQRRTVLDPGLDGRRWPLDDIAIEARRGHSDVGFRLVLE